MPVSLMQLRAQVGSLTTRALARELTARGWSERAPRRGKGSHRVFVKQGQRPIVVPLRLKRGTALGILSRLEADGEADDE